jgi:protein involved in polysaccharide export with SLBB domain
MRGGAIELVTSDTISSMKAIALAGGLSRTAQPSKAVVRHLNAQGIETSVAFVDLKKIMRGQAKDIELSEGDILIVPNSNLSAYLQQATQAGFQTGFLLLGRF